MSSSLSCAKLSAWIIAAALLQILGLLLFVSGFFPVKPALLGHSGPESYRAPTCHTAEDHEAINQVSADQLKSSYTEMSKITPSFDKLVLMVIDGLPAEFVLGKNNQHPTEAMIEAMPYTQSLLSNGRAIGFHAKAAPPTVTMPRLKAMVSGAIGGYLDVAFNFDTQAFLDDNLLAQLNSIGGKMVMFGDETWIKLFPGLFSRCDGVSSFYVKDTIEVDYNVSRHLETELTSGDWNLLILHYLGLDHVGHIGGRRSKLMFPKLKEMDEVIMRIHECCVLRPDSHNGRTLLLVVSDHGMTNSGNHGGSSYEETDSLALFIGLEYRLPDYASATNNTAFQVDIAPTLALLFGVPIPKNNVGVLIAEAFHSLSDVEQLRALELNSWQLLRLLQAQLPGLLCATCPYSGLNYGQSFRNNECKGSMEHKFCCLLSKATALHNSLTSQKDQSLRLNCNIDDFKETVAAYYDFLRSASNWLSRRATDKLPEFLFPGIVALLLSFVIFLSIVFGFFKGAQLRQRRCILDSESYTTKWHLDETFVVVVILILVFSMGSSSMVEEEQYIWHFMTSTLYLIFLRKSIQAFPAGRAQSLCNTSRRHQYDKYYQISSIILVLISGRVLRGWHQGGVNWVHLPDISKWLEKAGSHIMKSFKMVSVLLVISLSFSWHFRLRSKGIFVLVVQSSFFVSALLLLCIMKYQDHGFSASTASSIFMAQMVYVILSVTIMVGAIVSPWAVAVSTDTHSSAESHQHLNLPLLGLRRSAYLTGQIYMTCWCLLQLLVQQQTNALPISLLLLQVLAIMLYFSLTELQHEEWVEVATLYFLGMAGHYSFGNSNSLATIDVAGAFTGMSSHSTLLAGILMFIITYASPLLCLLSMMMYASLKDMSFLLASQDVHFGLLCQMTIGFPCVVPLCINSVILTAGTIMLLLMRNHLFIWSVFSPKYLYVCATTVCVYVGVSVVAATGSYICSVYLVRRKMLCLKQNSISRNVEEVQSNPTTS